MRTENKDNPVVAIVCADLHLSLNPPIARSKEPGWFEAMARSLCELEELAEEHHAPIFCAGDIFDHWRSPPELINFAVNNLPEMWAIPGQHDLPLHDPGSIHKSAYWTLVEFGKIHHITTPRLLTPLDGSGTGTAVRLYGFGWSQPIVPPEAADKILRVALVHAYTWIDSACFPGAPEGAKPSAKKYQGFDAVVIGDNHKSWEQVYKNTNVFNCGGFYRRRVDEVSHRPRVGLLRADGSIESHYLDTSQDVLVVLGGSGGERGQDPDFQAFLSELNGFQAADLDYKEALRRAMASPKVSPRVKQCLAAALEVASE